MRYTHRANKKEYPNFPFDYLSPSIEYFNDKNGKTAIKGNAIDKLGQLEDIEDELGIGLSILFKALKDGIWVKTKNGISKHHTIHLHKWQQLKLCLFYHPYSHLSIKDYGKTWALTKEELEK